MILKIPSPTASGSSKTKTSISSSLSIIASLGRYSFESQNPKYHYKDHYKPIKRKSFLTIISKDYTYLVVRAGEEDFMNIKFKSI